MGLIMVSINLPKAMWYAIALGLVQMVLWLSPLGQRIESEFGLQWYYNIRGTIDPPKKVSIVGIDLDTADWLAEFALAPKTIAPRLNGCLPTGTIKKLAASQGPENWPRELIACLVDRLAALGATVIVLDITFRANREEAEDKALTDAFQRAGKVVIAQKVRTFGSEVTRNPENSIIVQELPAPRLSGAAATAPFPLPSTGRYLNTFWVEFPAPDGKGSILTLPAAALGVLNADKLQPGNLTAGPDLTVRGTQTIWFYGPAGTIVTYPMWQVVSGQPIAGMKENLAGSAVFVGASDLINPDQPDTFPTVFRNRNGVNLSGVEIAATAFGNLRDGTLLRPLPTLEGAGLVFTIGFLLAYSGSTFSRYRGVIAVLAGATAIAVIAHLAFAKFQVWLPLAIPLTIGLPLAVLGSIIVRYEAVKNLVGVLTPEPVAQRMISTEQDTLQKSDQAVVTVLVTDLVDFTAMAESLPPATVTEYLSAHFQDVEEAVVSEGGVIDKFMGDGVLAIFGAPIAHEDHAVRACAAAQNIAARVMHFNQLGAATEFRRMQLRIGINTGLATVGEIGARGRHNFSVLGDVVNVAARLEKLGKEFAPEDDVVVLLGEPTANELPVGTPVSDLGLHQLRGRREPVRVFRLDPEIFKDPLAYT